MLKSKSLSLKYYFGISICFFILPFILNAQSPEIKKGDNFYRQNKFAQALEIYLSVYDKNAEDALLNYRIGNCYLKSITKAKAVKYLEKAEELQYTIEKDLYYLLAQAYHQSMQWDKAIDAYTSYTDGLTLQEIKTLGPIIEKKIEECKVGKILLEKPVKVKIENIGATINSAYPDYAPVISSDEAVLMFTSRRDGSTGGKDKLTGEYDEDVFVSYQKNEKWSQAKNIGTPISTKEHDSNIALSNDGQKLILYKDDNGIGNIYESVQKGDKWSTPEKLQTPISTNAHESSASYSPDGKILYFVSNRPDGVGGRDIYYARLNDKGQWDNVTNIGNTINTPYDEEGVFMHPDGKTLYFSSQGHQTMGGFDIFKSVLDSGKWSKPENIGYPINSPDDDLFFVLAASGLRGYYASVKDGGFGDLDIYVINFIDQKPIVYVTILKGTITDAVTSQPLEADIEIIDNEKNESVARFNSNSATGNYLVSLPSGKNYGIAVNAKGYLFHSENVNIPPATGYQEIIRDIALQKIIVGSKTRLNNIFFDYDKATLRKESIAELDRLVTLLKNTPGLRIQISGHTDNRGSADYNQKLSENRAKAVVDYLIEKGIAQDRLQYKGYGFSSPVATNDNEEGRQMNRRTEFEILDNK